MGLTATEKGVFTYFQNNDFVSLEVIDTFRNKLKEEGNSGILLLAIEKFVKEACPKCGTSGFYKHHFLGKLTHPDCGCSWYMSPGTYIGTQLKSVFRAGRDIGGDMAMDAEKKGEKGIFEMLFGFIMGAAFRLPFAVIMIPIQSIVSLSQKKG